MPRQFVQNKFIEEFITVSLLIPQNTHSSSLICELDG